jgi:hypothetical protein
MEKDFLNKKKNKFLKVIKKIIRNIESYFEI